MRTLVAIPVYNEERHIAAVLPKVLAHSRDVLVIDDGSKDRTPELLAQFPVDVIRHGVNRGYGRSIIDAMRWADAHRYDWLITMDCDEQHEPGAIPQFLRAASRGDGDIISGSRYLVPMPADDAPPPERRRINTIITKELNDRLGLALTDAFCGFKAYRVAALKGLRLSENGYAMPIQFWAQAAAAGLRIAEIPVRLIYNDPNRSFGAALDNPEVRLAHYRGVLELELARQECAKAPAASGCSRRGLAAGPRAVFDSPCPR